MSRNSILLSIKPIYADKIFSGEKSVELRRKLPKHIKKGDLVLVYVSSPKKFIYGAFTVSKILEASVNQLWKKVSNKASISKESFNEYFSGSEIGYGIFINNYWSFHDPICLDEIRTYDESFNIPQSYRYLTESDFNLINIEFGISLV